MISNIMITIVNLSINGKNTEFILFPSAPYNRSVAQPDSSKTLLTELKSTPSTSHPPSKKSPPDQTRSSKSKGNKSKRKYANHLLKKKHSIKSFNPMLIPSMGLSSKPIDTISTPPISSNKTTKKSVTNAVISYLQYRGVGGGKHRTGRSMTWE